MLSKLLFNQKIFFSLKINLDSFQYEDYQTMCLLLKSKYVQHNQQIKAIDNIRLIDQNSKIIGTYPASEARKKAQSLKKDMLLVNNQVEPIICKVADFRSQTIENFYKQIVLKRNQSILSKSKDLKSLKISPSIKGNQLQLKIRQITQMSNKYLKIRVYTSCKQEHKDEALQKLQNIKSQLQNKCYIQEDISNRRYEQDKGEQEQTTSSKHRKETYSFVLRSRDNSLASRLLAEIEDDPENAVRTFIKKYVKQEDNEMKDLRSTIIFGKQTEKKEQQYTLDMSKESKIESEVQTISGFDEDTEKEAMARILNKRLVQILKVYQ